MENGKVFDEATMVLMAAIAALGDLPLLFAWLALLIPVVGLVVFGLVAAWNLILVAILVVWFIIKSAHSLKELRELASLRGIDQAISFAAVEIIFGIGMLLGLIFPVKLLTVLLAAFIANTKLGQILTQVAATVAVGVATGGAGAVAEVGVAAEGAAAAAETGVAVAETAEAGEAVAAAGETGAAAAEAGETAGAEAASKEALAEEELGPKKGSLRELKESLEKIPELEKEEEEEEDTDATQDSATENNGGGGAELDENVVDLKKTT